MGNVDRANQLLSELGLEENADVEYATFVLLSICIEQQKQINELKQLMLPLG